MLRDAVKIFNFLKEREKWGVFIHNTDLAYSDEVLG